jgi:hypothetical protein
MLAYLLMAIGEHVVAVKAAAIFAALCDLCWCKRRVFVVMALGVPPWAGIAVVGYVLAVACACCRWCWRGATSQDAFLYS